MSETRKLIEKAKTNYKLIEKGNRSIAKGRVLNEVCNSIIKLKLIELKEMSNDITE